MPGRPEQLSRRPPAGHRSLTTGPVSPAPRDQRDRWRAGSDGLSQQYTHFRDRDVALNPPVSAQKASTSTTAPGDSGLPPPATPTRPPPPNACGRQLFERQRRTHPRLSDCNETSPVTKHRPPNRGATPQRRSTTRRRQGRHCPPVQAEERPLNCTNAVVTADNRALPEPSPRSAAQASIASPPPDRDGGTPDWNVRTPASRRRSRCRITSPARTELPGDYGISHERGRSVATFAQGPRPCRRPSTTASSDAWESRGALGRVELLRILRRLGSCSSPWRTGRLGARDAWESRGALGVSSFYGS